MYEHVHEYLSKYGMILINISFVCNPTAQFPLGKSLEMIFNDKSGNLWYEFLYVQVLWTSHSETQVILVFFVFIVRELRVKTFVSVRPNNCTHNTCSLYSTNALILFSNHFSLNLVFAHPNTRDMACVELNRARSFRFLKSPLTFNFPSFPF